MSDGRLRALGVLSLQKTQMDLGAVFYWLKGQKREIQILRSAQRKDQRQEAHVATRKKSLIFD